MIPLSPLRFIVSKTADKDFIGQRTNNNCANVANLQSHSRWYSLFNCNWFGYSSTSILVFLFSLLLVIHMITMLLLVMIINTTKPHLKCNRDLKVKQKDKENIETTFSRLSSGERFYDESWSFRLRKTMSGHLGEYLAVCLSNRSVRPTLLFFSKCISTMTNCRRQESD